jgi:hypothetical protein
VSGLPTQLEPTLQDIVGKTEPQDIPSATTCALGTHVSPLAHVRPASQLPSARHGVDWAPSATHVWVGSQTEPAAQGA